MKPSSSVLLLLAGAAWAQGGVTSSWNFDSDPVGQPPPGFSFARTGAGTHGKWVVQAEKDAPSAPNVLAQTTADKTDNRFPLAVANNPVARDVKVSVRCKPVSGKLDQACGLAFRYRDENNYYVARANALEDNVNLYHVVSGNRREVKGWSGKVASGAWHQLAVQAQGEHLQVFFDGKLVIDATDRTFTQPGKVGLWTKADSVTLFDDFTVGEAH